MQWGSRGARQKPTAELETTGNQTFIYKRSVLYAFFWLRFIDIIASMKERVVSNAEEMCTKCEVSLNQSAQCIWISSFVNTVLF